MKKLENMYKLKYTSDKLEKVDEKLDYIYMRKEMDEMKNMVILLSGVIKQNNLKVDFDKER